MSLLHSQRQHQVCRPNRCCPNSSKVYALIALHTGQLVKDRFFTLFEAVGALEVILSPAGKRPPGDSGLDTDTHMKMADHGSENGQRISATGRDARR